MYSACMAVALQIRDVPEPVRDLLAARAAAKGQSLQAYLLALVTQEAAFLRNAEILNQPLPDGGVLPGTDTLAFLHAAREEQDEKFIRAFNDRH
jgi:hypothetical protein